MSTPRAVPTAVLSGRPGLDGSNVLPTDAAIAQAIEDEDAGPLTRAALSASIDATAATKTADKASALYGANLVRAPLSLASYLDTAASAATNRAGMTAALADIIADGTNEIVWPGGEYDYSFGTEGTALMSFANTDHIHIKALGDVLLNDTTVHTAQAGYTTPFLFDNCRDVSVTGFTADGTVIPTPTDTSVGLGYTGGTFARFINGCRDIVVEATLNNWRYGVQSGDYADSTKGACSGFEIQIRGEMVGYPVALQLARNIHKLEVDVDGVHRAAYLAGCNNVRGNIRFRSTYIAPYAVALTNTLYSGTDTVAEVAPPANPTTSLGCSDIELTIQDKGSTQFVANSAIAGIFLQRVDASVFKDIHLHIIGAGATDTISTTVTALAIVSGNAPSIWSRYVDEWTSDIVLDNIEVTGSIDHSAQTVRSSTFGEVYIHTEDFTNPAAYATVKNIKVDMDIKKSSGGTQVESRFRAPGHSGRSELSLRAPGVDVAVYTNATSEVELKGTVLKDLDVRSASGQSRILLGSGTVIDSMTNGTGTRRVVTRGGRLAGAGTRKHIIDELVTLSGASTNAANQIPQGATVTGVYAYVKTAITGSPSGWFLGVAAAGGMAADADRYSRFQNANTLGTIVGPAHYQSDMYGTTAGTGIVPCPLTYQFATTMVFTSSGGNFSGGVVHLYVEYEFSDYLTA